MWRCGACARSGPQRKNSADGTCSTGSTAANKDFNPEMYAKLYKELADEQDSGKSLSYRYTSHDGPKTAVVNMTAKWGDVAATTKIMDKYVDQAAEKNVDVLVFPEMALNGYQYVKPDNGEDPMQVKTAETKDGPTAKHFAELAKKNNRYIIYGASEMPEGGPITENGKKKVYNFAFICSLDGTVDTYQKIPRAGAEDQWSVAGNTLLGAPSGVHLPIGNGPSATTSRKAASEPPARLAWERSSGYW